MANIRSGNTWYVDSSSNSTDSTSYVDVKNLKLIGIIYTLGATDKIELFDKNPSSTSAGSKKFSIISGTANDTRQLKMAESPVLFTNGMWVTLTGTPTATLIFALQGNSGS